MTNTSQVPTELLAAYKAARFRVDANPPIYNANPSTLDIPCLLITSSSSSIAADSAMSYPLVACPVSPKLFDPINLP